MLTCLDLPQDFLSTPFGAGRWSCIVFFYHGILILSTSLALRPTIDNMYRRPSGPTVGPSPTPSNMELGASLLQAVASQAASGSARAPYPTPVPTPPRAAESTLTGPIQIASNPASLRSLIASHRCVTVFFTSPTCAPCRIVEPVFEDLARNKASKGVAFAKADLATGLGSQIASQWSIRATPTFLFFLDGEKARVLACGGNLVLTLCIGT